jgi:hypothetical protein
MNRQPDMLLLSFPVYNNHSQAILDLNEGDASYLLDTHTAERPFAAQEPETVMSVGVPWIRLWPTTSQAERPPTSSSALLPSYADSSSGRTSSGKESRK